MYATTPLFPRFVYTLNGKDIMLELCEYFANEFNRQAEKYLTETHGRTFHRLKVTGAYPSTRQEMPLIAVIRQGIQPQPSGIGYEIEEIDAGGAGILRRLIGEVVTDTIEVSICTVNPLLRDDLFGWFQQWMLDAIIHFLPQVTPIGIQSIRNLGGTDDTVVYEGAQGQPGFEFYTGRLIYSLQYDQMILQDVDSISSIFNWQNLYPDASMYRGHAGTIPDGFTPQPGDSSFQP